MSLVRVQSFSGSLDGFDADEGHSDDAPLRRAGDGVHERGPNPPVHAKVLALTHHLHPSIEMEGDTTSHFVDASPAELLEVPRLPPPPYGHP